MSEFKQTRRKGEGVGSGYCKARQPLAGQWPLNWPSPQPGAAQGNEETVGSLRAPGAQPWEHRSPLETADSAQQSPRGSDTHLPLLLWFTTQPCPPLCRHGLRHAGFPVLPCLPELAPTRAR